MADSDETRTPEPGTGTPEGARPCAPSPPRPASGGKAAHPAAGAEPKPPIPKLLLTVIVYTTIVTAVVVLLVTLTSLVWYFWRFFLLPLGASSSARQWADFSNTMMPMLQTLVGIATLGAAIYVASEINSRFEERRRLEEQSRIEAEKEAGRDRELLRLSEMLVNVEFYTKVTYPAWEVALKWLGWEGQKGDKYRAQVVAGEVEFPIRVYLDHPDFSYWIREHHHNHPYDMDRIGTRGCGISELPESLAFATWMRFWHHIKFLIDQGFLRKEGVRKLLKEWYVWWAPFMAEYLEVTRECLEALGQPVDSNCALVKVLELHTEDLEIPVYYGHASKAEFQEKVDKVVAAVLPLLRKARELS
jgi:hypothetical protein